MEYPGVSVACRWVWIASFLEGASPVLDTLTSSAQGWTVISVTTTMTIKIRFVNFFLGAFPIKSCALLFVLLKNGTFTLYGRPYKKTMVYPVKTVCLSKLVSLLKWIRSTFQFYRIFRPHSPSGVNPWYKFFVCFLGLLRVVLVWRMIEYFHVSCEN